MMTSTMKLGRLTDAGATALWIALVAGASILFSAALACVTPFAALATIAGAKLRGRDAMVLVGFAWLTNQAIGYLLLGYPQTPGSFAWGAAIGIAALIAAMPAYVLVRRTRPITALIGGFGAAFLLFEAVLFAATIVLPSSAEAFAPSVVWQIFWINAVALAGLAGLHWAAISVGIAPRIALPPPALSRA